MLSSPAAGARSRLFWTTLALAAAAKLDQGSALSLVVLFEEGYFRDLQLRPRFSPGTVDLPSVSDVKSHCQDPGPEPERRGAICI